MRWCVVENEFDIDLRVLVARRLFGLCGAALDLLLVDLGRLLDLDTLNKAREDDPVHLDDLVFGVNHCRLSLLVMPVPVRRLDRLRVPRCRWPRRSPRPP